MGEAVVFDAEPIVAYLEDESGSGVVEGWIDRIASSEVVGHISPSGARSSGGTGGLVYSKEACWETAAAFGTRFDLPLGDAYALATADTVDGTLLVGGDDDLKGFAVPIERFRDEPARAVSV